MTALLVSRSKTHCANSSRETAAAVSTAQTPINPREAYILRVECDDSIVDDMVAPDQAANKKKLDVVNFLFKGAPLLVFFGLFPFSASFFFSFLDFLPRVYAQIFLVGYTCDLYM
jgi:hypothetical protein